MIFLIEEILGQVVLEHLANLNGLYLGSLGIKSGVLVNDSSFSNLEGVKRLVIEPAAELLSRCYGNSSSGFSIVNKRRIASNSFCSQHRRPVDIIVSYLTRGNKVTSLCKEVR